MPDFGEIDDKTYDPYFQNVYVNGKKVTSAVITKGSVNIELKPEYLETLTNSTHKLTAEFVVSGNTYNVDVEFRVYDSSTGVPTGDENTLVGISALVLLISFLYSAYFIRKEIGANRAALCAASDENTGNPDSEEE